MRHLLLVAGLLCVMGCGGSSKGPAKAQGKLNPRQEHEHMDKVIRENRQDLPYLFPHK